MSCYHPRSGTLQVQTILDNGAERFATAQEKLRARKQARAPQ